ncbi:translocation/assembly module TamB domain-containing protein [Ensifer soli]|uniref:translocation/assembly module TamB domain-containing protein n=1 Tax=Ciceribacter sp. sgz301302 TaxID=3342379 RepID=UPI0035B8EA40
MNQFSRIVTAVTRWLFLGLGALVGLALLLVLFVGFTAPGARLAVSFIERFASTPDQIVTINDPDGLLTGKLTAGAITLNDGKGIYAEVRDLSVSWSPLDLLSGRFSAAALSAGTVRIERLPTPSNETEEVRSAFALPVEIHIDRLTIDELMIGKAIAGTDQVLTVAGAVDATNESIALTLQAAERDRPEAAATADIVYDPANNALKIKAGIDEPKGGTLAKLLRLPGEPAVNITVDGAGPLSDWAGKATAALDGTPLLSIDATHRRAEDGVQSVTVAGGGDFAGLMPPVFRPLFAGTASIDIAAAFSGSDWLRIDRGKVSTAAFTLDASGTAGTRGENNLRATLGGADGPVDFRWPMEGGEARLLIDSVNLSLIGEAQAAILDVAATLASVEMPQGRIETVNLSAYSDSFDLKNRTGTLTTRVSTGATALANADLDRLIKGPVTLNGTLGVSPETIRFDPLTLESASIGGTVNGSYGISGNTVETAFKLFALPAVLPPAIAEKFDTTVALAGTLTRDAEGRLSVEGLDIASGTVTGKGSLSLDGDAVAATLDGTLPDLGKLLADARGNAAFDLAVSGTLDAPAIRLGLTSSGATLAGRTLSDLVLSADATLPPTGPEASLTATGALGGQAINVKANVVSRDGATSIPELQAQIGENRLSGALALTDDFKPNGALSFTFPDIALLAAMAGEKAAGDLAGSVDIRTTNGVTSLALKASGGGIRRDALAVTRPVVDLTVADIARLAAKGRITAESVAQGDNRLSRLALDVDHDGAATGFRLRGDYDGAPLAADGSVAVAGGRTTVRLSSFSAAPRRIPLALSQPVAITIENGRVTLGGLTIGASGGTVAVSGTAGERLDLALRLNALPAALANTFSPSLGAEGRIGGTVNVTGTAAAPVVAYDLTWTGAAAAQTRSAGVGPFGITAKGRLADNTLTIDTALSGGGLSFRGGGTLGITGSMPANLRFSGTLPFDLVDPFLAPQGFQLTGSAAADVAVSGPIRSPQITGSVTTSGARLVDVRRNLAIEGLTARVTLSGNQATIASATGRLSTGGTLTVGGTIGTAPGSGFPANLQITLRNLTYADGALVTATANGALTVTGPLASAPVLGGRIDVGKASITIPQKLPSSLSEIAITHRNASGAVKRMTSDLKQDQGGGGTAGGGGTGLGFNLVVDAPSRIFVRGRGIDAELGGRLTITGTAASPSISGGFTMRRGRLEILAKRLDFTDRSSITFGGGMVPTLNLDATTTAGSTTITVNVAGPANNPAVTFTSSPALPQDEILAQLIFNRSLSNLSALQIAQLASAVSQLAGGQSTSLLDGLRNKLGVDDLDITTDESGGAQVRAGKYLNDRTYIELQSGTEAGGGKAVINLDVGRGVKLRGEAGADGSAAGIFYEKEY